MSESVEEPRTPRPSRCGEAAREAARARVRDLSPTERMIEALRLHAALVKLRAEPPPDATR